MISRAFENLHTVHNKAQKTFDSTENYVQLWKQCQIYSISRWNKCQWYTWSRRIQNVRCRNFATFQESGKNHFEVAMIEIVGIIEKNHKNHKKEYSVDRLIRDRSNMSTEFDDDCACEVKSISCFMSSIKHFFKFTFVLLVQGLSDFSHLVSLLHYYFHIRMN